MFEKKRMDHVVEEQPLLLTADVDVLIGDLERCAPACCLPLCSCPLVLFVPPRSFLFCPAAAGPDPFSWGRTQHVGAEVSPEVFISRLLYRPVANQMRSDITSNALGESARCDMTLQAVEHTSHVRPVMPTARFGIQCDVQQRPLTLVNMMIL